MRDWLGDLPAGNEAKPTSPFLPVCALVTVII